MTTPIKSILTAIAAGFLLAGGVGLAQEEQNLTEDEVRSLFETMGEEMTEAVRMDEFERVLELTEEHLADEAMIMASNEIFDGEERKSFIKLTLDKEDMLRLGQMMAGMMSGAQGQSVEDYLVEIEVTDVTLIGPNAAVVAAEYTESGTIMPPNGGQGEVDAAEEAQGELAEPRQIDSTSRCEHLVYQSEEEDRLLISLSACEARTVL
jgi:hypothetical protein